MTDDIENKQTENTVSGTDAASRKDKPWQFKPGVSANPSGKPKGTRNKASQAMMLLLEGETEALTRKAIEMALAGDTTALRLCIDRLCPAPKSAAQYIDIALPSGTLTDIARAFVMAAASGEIPPDIAAQLVSAVGSVAKVEEMETIKERLEAIEKALKGSKQ